MKKYAAAALIISAVFVLAISAVVASKGNTANTEFNKSMVGEANTLPEAAADLSDWLKVGAWITFAGSVVAGFTIYTLNNHRGLGAGFGLFVVAAGGMNLIEGIGQAGVITTALMSLGGLGSLPQTFPGVMEVEGFAEAYGQTVSTTTDVLADMLGGSFISILLLQFVMGIITLGIGVRQTRLGIADEVSVPVPNAEQTRTAGD
ncbi:MAG TPA: hypothetical protein VJZ27_05805 [Aggregatilineales bacterium]|nr:hypothetical protein [Aggregatilineales bacterium]